MKYIALLGLVASLATFTVPAAAQTARPTPNAAMRQHFQQMRSQMRQIRTTERSQMLAALSPSNRSLLANIAGQLATTANPDYRAAAGRLDASLSAGEKQAILNAAQTARTSRRALMQNVRRQFEANHPGTQHGERPEGQRRTPDPGMLLLSLAASPERGMMGAPGMMHP
ncbi:MAG TPA: hypothetical protein VFE17_11145 [Candidatus Baltobacteraceae bacterium]|jgi:hypothetical protein|nr:hypothetical protein [Candidatus Baltobacteraceae bacterium]